MERGVCNDVYELLGANVVERLTHIYTKWNMRSSGISGTLGDKSLKDKTSTHML